MVRKKQTKTGFVFEIESDILSCSIIPTPGAKIISLKDKRTNREWFVPPMRPLEETGFDAVFTDQSMCGWDEMLFTIDPCLFHGKMLPDHGEVWGRSWKCEVTDNSVTASIECQCYPARFSRCISLQSENTLSFIYHLHNLSSETVPWFWAAHPQFAADTDTRLVLPDSVKQLVNVIQDDPVFGASGNIIDFPLWKPENGRDVIDLTGLPGQRSCRKLYCLLDSPIDHAGLFDESSGHGLEMNWDSTRIRCCGFWYDEGIYNKNPVIAIEPSSAFYDNPNTAEGNNSLVYVEAGGEISWNVSIKLI